MDGTAGTPLALRTDSVNLLGPPGLPGLAAGLKCMLLSKDTKISFLVFLDNMCP